MARKMSTANCYLLVVLLMAIFLNGFTGQTRSKPRLQSSNQDQEVNDLLMILRDEQIREQEPDRLVKAIERLGQMQSVAAIDDLIRLLTFRRTFPWENTQVDILEEDICVTPLSRYPAAGALFQIGKPALPMLVKVIEEEEPGSLATENALYTIKRIFRDDISAGVDYLKEATAKEPSRTAAYRLSIAAEEMERYREMSLKFKKP